MFYVTSSKWGLAVLRHLVDSGFWFRDGIGVVGLRGRGGGTG